VTPSTPILLTPHAHGSGLEVLPGTGVGLGIETKTHALRSVFGERERAACPFPGNYGGKEKLGVSEEDEKDETLMAICAAIAINVSI
jgi:hypothetical protein